MGKTNNELLIHYFLKACKENNNSKVLTILESENFNINSTDEYGNTGLHIACFHGNHNIVRRLIMFKADVNYKNIYGYTPLMFSCGHPSKRDKESFYENCEYL